jgi:hypothetical protein
MAASANEREEHKEGDETEVERGWLDLRLQVILYVRATCDKYIFMVCFDIQIW